MATAPEANGAKTWAVRAEAVGANAVKEAKLREVEDAPVARKSH
jgi:hypothetical protein